MDDEVRQIEEQLRRSGDEGLALAGLVAGLRVGRPSTRVLGWVLTLERWSGLPQELQDGAARSLELLLGSDGFRFVGLERHRLGNTSQQVACFERRERRFALIPAGEVQLGFDQDLLTPSEPQREHFDSMVRDLQPIRAVHLSPFLIETSSSSWPGWAYFGATVDAHGFIHSEFEELMAHVASFERDGLRLPTCDQWELACSGGSRSLFRWGADHPNDQAPELEGPWRLHREPNGFGLTMPGNSYAVELCRPWNIRGGDAGIQSHHGRDMLSWLSLASAYDGTRALEEDAGLGLDETEPRVRLVRSLFDDTT